MGSRRGRIREVWTLNFDDVLKWYLRVNGFVSQVITEVPSLLKDADVSVYHPHGYLPSDPHNGKASARIVFDDTSYANRLVGTDEPLREATRNILASKIVLAVGLSWNDDILKNLVIDTASKIKVDPWPSGSLVRTHQSLIGISVWPTTLFRCYLPILTNTPRTF